MSSPDLPGLVGGFATRAEVADTDAVLEMAVAAGMSPHASHRLYFGEVFNAGDMIVTARFEDDARRQERVAALDDLIGQLEAAPEFVNGLLTDELGDVTIIVCLPGDSLRKATRPFVAEQTTFLALVLADGEIVLSPALVDRSATPGDEEYFQRLGLSVDSTVLDLYEASGGSEPGDAEAHSLRGLVGAGR